MAARAQASFPWRRRGSPMGQNLLSSNGDREVGTEDLAEEASGAPFFSDRADDSVAVETQAILGADAHADVAPFAPGIGHLDVEAARRRGRRLARHAARCPRSEDHAPARLKGPEVGFARVRRHALTDDLAKELGRK